MGQKLSQFYHLQINVVETWQCCPFELIVYFASNTAAETAFMNMNSGASKEGQFLDNLCIKQMYNLRILSVIP